MYETGLGWGGVASGNNGLLEVILPFAGYSRESLAANIIARYPRELQPSQLTDQAARDLHRYFAGEIVQFDFPLDLDDFTPFQRGVYQMVARLPFGTVMTYGEVAALMGSRGSARGVGGAMARNPLPVIIPCHRVVGSGGGLTGYSAPGGVVSKEWLLRMEGGVIGGNGKIVLVSNSSKNGPVLNRESENSLTCYKY
jgi:methylated-DNA-[protein]-cysteine S-methyltransferase